MILEDSTYSVVKDFAGPAATFFAAMSALFYVRRQTLTAEKQAETALDQLRYNLFERRYAIYNDIKSFLHLLLKHSNNYDFDELKIVEHYVVMDEASFFFPPDICIYIKKLKNDCKSLINMTEQQLPRSPRYTQAKSQLAFHLQQLPSRFQKELRFKQLTRARPNYWRRLYNKLYWFITYDPFLAKVWRER